MRDSHSLKKRSEFIFLRLVTRFIKKIPKNPPLPASPKFSSPSQKLCISLLFEIFCVPPLKNFNLLQLEISYFYRYYISLPSVATLASQEFFFPHTRALQFHRHYPPFLSLSLSIPFFTISKACWCPLCSFEIKLRMTEQETLFAIEQAILKL